MSTLTASDFLLMMEQRLQPAGVPFSRAALICWLEATWPLVEDDPDVERWAAEFLATGDVMAPE